VIVEPAGICEAISKYRSVRRIEPTRVLPAKKETPEPFTPPSKKKVESSAAPIVTESARQMQAQASVVRIVDRKTVLDFMAAS
jgi:hypothetical protein